MSYLSARHRISMTIEALLLDVADISCGLADQAEWADNHRFTIYHL